MNLPRRKRHSGSRPGNSQTAGGRCDTNRRSNSKAAGKALQSDPWPLARSMRKSMRSEIDVATSCARPSETRQFQRHRRRSAPPCTRPGGRLPSSRAISSSSRSPGSARLPHEREVPLPSSGRSSVNVVEEEETQRRNQPLMPGARTPICADALEKAKRSSERTYPGDAVREKGCNVTDVPDLYSRCASLDEVRTVSLRSCAGRSGSDGFITHRGAPVLRGGCLTPRFSRQAAVSTSHVT